MTNTKSGVYVTHIGIDRIYIRGEDATKYSELPNVKVNERSIEKCGEDTLIRTFIMYFQNEREMIDFLQDFVDLDVPFTDDNKSTAYMTACDLKKQGKLKGEILEYRLC